MTTDDILVQRVHHRLATAAERVIIGIAGCPGAGKSTVAQRLVAALGAYAVGVPMDGFHLANSVLASSGRRDRKGAPDTFDLYGYVALLHRLRVEADRTVFAPEFRRDLEEPIAGAILVPSAARVVITEGNYLLHDRDGWEQVRPLLDECWYVDVPDSTRLRRLTERHVAFGKSPEEAERWARGPDERNAELIRANRGRADWVLENL